MIIKEGIRCETSEICFLCGTHGIVIYMGLRDRLFGALGEWGHMRCPACGLVWLNPRPVPEDIEKIYKNYYTHSSLSEVPQKLGRFARLRKKVGNTILAARFGYSSEENVSKDNIMGWIFSLIPSFREKAGRKVLWIDKSHGGKLLDVGCGSGEYLAYMRQMGWEASGVEPDPSAVLVARKKYGLNIWQGSLGSISFPNCSFHVITINHVIEHLDNPIMTLKECARLLKPGGKIVLLTPNIESWGHRLFKKSWLGLDPPRHYHLFSMKALKKCIELAGLTMVSSRAPSIQAVFNWQASSLLQQNNSPDAILNRAWITQPWKRRLEGRFFYWGESFWTKIDPVGEEILMIVSNENEYRKS